VAFYAATSNKIVARLKGVVTWKRVAARQRLLGEFGLGSVSVHSSSAEGLKQEEVGGKSFLANRRQTREWFLACSNSGRKSFLARRSPSRSVPSTSTSSRRRNASSRQFASGSKKTVGA